MERITKAHLQTALERFTKAHGWRIATAYNDVDGFRIDHYNGYLLERIVTETGGVSHPFGSRRYTARELFEMLNFATEIAFLQDSDYRFAKGT